MTLYLLRHARTVANEEGVNDSHTDGPLSTEGKKQAEELVSELSKHSYDVIIVSPLSRTQKTIEPYLKTLKKPTVLVEDIVTERDLGELTNTLQNDGKIEESQKKSGKDKVFWVPPGGESLERVYGRAKLFLHTVRSMYPDKSVLLCSHSGFLRCLEFAILGKPIEDFYTDEHPLFENTEIRVYEVSSRS